MLGSAEISESGVKVSSRILQRYVLRGEHVEVATRQHWAVMGEPVATVVFSFLFIGWVSGGLERAFGDFGLYLWWVWIALVIRLLWKMLEWRNEWFVATDKRLLLTYGLVAHKVAMMPLRKVTDMTYARSIFGRALSYGTFVLESAGQDQALQRVNWVPKPDKTYREICDIIFAPGVRHVDDDEDSLDSAEPEVRGNHRDAEHDAEHDDDSGDAEHDDVGEHEEAGWASADASGFHDSGFPWSEDESSQPASFTDDELDWRPDHQRSRGPDGSAGESDHALPEPPEDAGWQTSHESASTYQRVSPRESPSGPE